MSNINIKHILNIDQAQEVGVIFNNRDMLRVHKNKDNKTDWYYESEQGLIPIKTEDYKILNFEFDVLYETLLPEEYIQLVINGFHTINATCYKPWETYVYNPVDGIKDHTGTQFKYIIYTLNDKRNDFHFEYSNTVAHLTIVTNPTELKTHVDHKINDIHIMLTKHIDEDSPVFNKLEEFKQYMETLPDCDFK